MKKMRHQSLIFIKCNCVKLSNTFDLIKKHTVHILFSTVFNCKKNNDICSTLNLDKRSNFQANLQSAKKNVAQDLMMNINYATLIKIGGPKVQIFTLKFTLNHFLAPEALYFNLKKDNDKKLHDSCLTFEIS